MFRDTSEILAIQSVTCSTGPSGNREGVLPQCTQHPREQSLGPPPSCAGNKRVLICGRPPRPPVIQHAGLAHCGGAHVQHPSAARGPEVLAPGGRQEITLHLLHVHRHLANTVRTSSQRAVRRQKYSVLPSLSNLCCIAGEASWGLSASGASSKLSDCAHTALSCHCATAECTCRHSLVLRNPVATKHWGMMASGTVGQWLFACTFGKRPEGRVRHTSERRVRSQQRG